jgi:hypothetical protein
MVKTGERGYSFTRLQSNARGFYREASRATSAFMKTAVPFLPYSFLRETIILCVKIKTWNRYAGVRLSISKKNVRMIGFGD